MKKIRELGSLPADAFDKYQSTPVKAVSILPKLRVKFLLLSIHFTFFFLFFYSVKRSSLQVYFSRNI